MKRVYSWNGQAIEVEVEPHPGGLRLVVDGQAAEMELLHRQWSRVIFRLGGNTHEARVAVNGRDVWVAFGGQVFHLEKGGGGRRRAGREAVGDERELRAPMPGQVRELLVLDGEAVAAGQTLLVLEAMKMEMRIQAHKAGVVRRVLVAAEQTVEKGQVLVEME